MNLACNGGLRQNNNEYAKCEILIHTNLNRVMIWLPVLEHYIFWLRVSGNDL